MSPFDAGEPATPKPLSDAVQAAALLAVDPGLGGILLRSWSGPVRDVLVRRLTGLRPAAVVRKMPAGISDDRLLGGLDLGATLAAGRPVFDKGILAEAEGGFLVLAMAERISAGTAARVGSFLDEGRNLTLIALDEGVGPDEAPPAALLDRLAFTVAALPDVDESWPGEAAVTAAATALRRVVCGPEAVAQICALAAMMGVNATRAEIFALRAARAAAALRGGKAVEEADIALAARLVLAPRATQMPESAAPPPAENPETPEPETSAESETPDKPLEDKVDEAEAALLPENLLAALAAHAAPRRITRGAGTSGAAPGVVRGRPAGVRRGELNGRNRLSILETLRAAAPWQRLRGAGAGHRVAVRAEDFRIRRFKEQPRRIAIFTVDASGSSALNRLAEAKGAILLLLADCYVQRDEVALIAFRGQGAEILLPPTSALARARRALAALPGGGPTPLAAGISAGLRLAAAEKRTGKQPLLVLLTDGGANIGADGKPGRAVAGQDAMAAAKICARENVAALVVDTSPRRQKFVAEIAGAMGARYLPLPYADSAKLSRAVSAFGGPNGRAAA
jgi:magnesium chelatase subunit D